MLIAGAVAAVVLLSSGSSPSHQSPTAATKARAGSTASHAAAANRGSPAKSGSFASPAGSSGSTSSGSSASGGTAGAAGSGSAGAAGSAASGGPVSAVETFYENAASHRYSAAWALADENFRNQLGGYASFQAGQEEDERIIFDSAQVVSQSAGLATVAVRTTSVRTNGTQHCAGTVQVVPGSGSWMVHQIGINCT